MRNMLRIEAAAAAAAAAFLFAAPAQAGTQQAPLAVNATVSANCTFTTSALNFSSIDTLSASPVDGTGGLSITCTNGSGWNASADLGSGSGATFANRRMTVASGTSTLNYSLYTDAARTTIWGDGSGSTSRITGTGTGTSQSITIYGRVPGSQTSAPAGSYSDTVSVTITY